ncbi:DNA adenine methylase [Desulfovibrionaceae bacterium CB1MN]|uniref:DNA adenine methylase n=1 Tax=Hydrosulfovibrio ferrireducens TaxID=2934181 RepID=UPI003ABB70C8
MAAVNSPLRYPGGKAILSEFLADVIESNGLQDGAYVEPYAGGAGAAFNLLFGEHVQRIVLNDADPCISAFWKAVLNRKDELIRLIKETPVTIDEWKRQRDIYRHQARHSRINVAFASFYLNRCNRSGIMVNGGPIGGFDQRGKWKLDARYNRNELIRRIEKIHLYRDRIEIHNLDAIDFLKNVVAQSEEIRNTLVYLDPPYFLKGRELYLNHYQPEDHAQLAAFIKRQGFRWIMSYDDMAEIRSLYEDCNTIPFLIDYSAHSRKQGKELLVYMDDLVLPYTRPEEAKGRT